MQHARRTLSLEAPQMPLGAEAGTPLSSRVLFVDDDPHVRKSFARVVRRMGFDVEVAGSGREALESVESRFYSAVVCDLRMPDMDGLSLIGRLHEVQPNASYVLASGASELDLPNDELLNRVVCFTLSKPWAMTDLKRTLTLATELYMARCREGSTSSNSNATESERPTQVLLLEDNPGDAELAIALLSDNTNAVFTRAARLGDALEYLRWDKFDIILADLSLPDARGLDTVASLHSIATKTPIVVLSGLADETLAAHAVQIGAQDYLVKGRLDSESLSRAVRYAHERKRVEERISQLAHMDHLTGVANRNAFFDQLDQLVARARRAHGRCYVMYVDLDRFKSINDTLGHDIGDKALCQFAKRLAGAVRESDVVGRLGGDEFAVAGGDLALSSNALDAAERILSALEQPVLLAGTQLRLRASIGIAVYPDAGLTRTALLNAADAAMYLAKRAGGNVARLADSISVQSKRVE